MWRRRFPLGGPLKNSQREIVVIGAREHNLKGVDIRLPRGALIAMTGVSGSGKSSLAFDTIFQEGQRRFVESLSSYARQFLGRTEKPKVEHIEGLSPTISIDQKTVNRSPRSTVGTVTEIHDHLRLMFARMGTPHCPSCGKPVAAQTSDRITDRVMASRAGKSVMVLAPIVKDRKGEYRKELEELRMKGYVRARIDGLVRRLDEPIELARFERHTIEVVLDRIKIEEERRSRLAEAVENGLKLGGGVVGVLETDDGVPESFSSRAACPDCDVSLPEMEPRTFSFNSPHGACPSCDGLGEREDVDPRLVIPDTTLSLAQGAIAPSHGASWSLRHHMGADILEAVCEGLNVPWDVPWRKLTEKQRKVILQGDPDTPITFQRSIDGERLKVRSVERKPWRGIMPILRAVYARLKGQSIKAYMAETPCTDCLGTRLRKEALAVSFRGRHIGDLGRLTVEDLTEFFATLQFDSREAPVGDPILKEIKARLRFLTNVGLGYLSMDRGVSTLSGGESQRIRLATQVGAGLRGILYVLDEPSIGLHQRDNRRLIDTLERLRDVGNTVIVVEHDRETMEASDWVVDVGPGAGRNGGEIVAAGDLAAVMNAPRSITGAFLSGREAITPPAVRRVAGEKRLVVRGARANNLKDIDVPIPLGVLVAVTGVSGSGKSTLINDILRKSLAHTLHRAEDTPGEHDGIDGVEHLDKVIEIDQSPIGRTPRSNPATYTKIFDEIRGLFSELPEAKARGYAPGRFSFNVKGGRCETCGGAGVKVVEMQFLADVEVPCDLCEGRRFNPETLEIQYREKSITDVLEMTIDEALAFFGNHPKIRRGLEMLSKVGLGYVALGQPSTTLSGGEAQRVKLASQLQRPPTGRTIYVLDEPTTGLHFVDVRRLLEALHALVDAGNSVVVIEHHLDVIASADWIIDMGPEGGRGGGQLIFSGPYHAMLRHTESATAAMLREAICPPEQKKKGVREVRDTAIDGDIILKGARLHNLKNIDVSFPAGRMTVVTGPSGSGKTSLVFDTLFAEGQRRFVECLSTYARQFLGRMDRPPIDSLEGLAPAIAIDQKNASRNPRSTVSTTTEIHDYFRLLWSRVGVPHCPTCSKEARSWSPDRVVKSLMTSSGVKGRILSPLYMKGSPLGLAAKKPSDVVALVKPAVEAGFMRLQVDGSEVRLDEKLPSFAKAKEVFLVIDRAVISEKGKSRLLDSFAQAFHQGRGYAAFESTDDKRSWFALRPACVECGFILGDDLTPRHFSFNSHSGACETCHGLGVELSCNTDLLIANPDRPLFDGALIEKPGDFLARSDGWFRGVVERLAKARGVNLKKPWSALPAAFKKAVLKGSEDPLDVTFASKSETSESSWSVTTKWKGFCAYIEEWFSTSEDEEWREILGRVMRSERCRSCNGERLKPAYRSVRFASRVLADVSSMTVEGAASWFETLVLDANESIIAEQPLREVRNRLKFLKDVGLGYLELSRGAGTLSGGEAQRIRLATQIGNRLTGVIYVLDEPTIGLHPRDSDRLISTLEGLRDLGNTVVMVEHDRDTIERADHVIDIGPGAGKHGGAVVFTGTPRQLIDEADTLTGRYLRGTESIRRPAERLVGNGNKLILENVTANNLKGIDVEIPLGVLVAVTGVSGSGKSSLVMDTLAPALAQSTGRRRVKLEGLGGLRGAEHIEDCIVVDQAPIGSSPKSNPASYTKVFDEIRAIFAEVPLARQRGYGPGRFSFNVGAGRCEACDGRGSIKVEMHFLPDVWIVCDACRGKRYNAETLAVEFKGKTIADVLCLEVSEAVAFFANHRRVAGPMQLLEDVGLGYIELGQSATTLSGGEAQRIKLARELARRSSGRTLYLLDEPTTGLHMDDVAKLVVVLRRLVEAGNTVLVIEHNMDVIRACDHVIDLGPEGGHAGGYVVACGTPEDIAQNPNSHTGRFLVDPKVTPVKVRPKQRHGRGANKS